MQKTKIEWATHTWNPMTGCKHGCPYCYAKQTAENPFLSRAFPYGFEPHFYPNRLREPMALKNPAIIFADSMSDIFGEWWTLEQIRQVLFVMNDYRGAHWHKFVVLTKNPKRMAMIMSEQSIIYDPPDHFKNIYFGTSVTGEDSMVEMDRLNYLKQVHDMGFKTVASFEPLLHDPKYLISIVNGELEWLDWIIIGGQTKPTKIPPFEWITHMKIRPNMPVFFKDNLGFKSMDRTKMFPTDLLPIAQAWRKA